MSSKKEKNLRNKIDTGREKIERLSEQYNQVSYLLRDECLKYLIAVLKMNGNSIDWRNKNLPEYIVVTYGGNHPEYASNAFSTVYGVMLDKKGNVILDIEDCSQYDSYISAEELLNVCHFIDCYSEEIGIKV